MPHKLEDIIDLDFLVNLDHDVENKSSLEKCLKRDRHIFQQIEATDLTDTHLLWEWYRVRLEQYEKQQSNDSLPLPGKLFSQVTTWMSRAIFILGFLTGFILAGSFLVYHGAHPVNVTVFFTLFIAIPLILSFTALICFFVYGVGKRPIPSNSVWLLFQSLFKAICFDMLPKVLEKVKNRTGSISQTEKITEFNDLINRLRTSQYKSLFFWPFFRLASLFSALFSFGSLAATFFKVLVSDMAFGWQSTMISSADTIHSIVSAISLPWSVFLPIMHAPTLEQVEGSKIILKQGISVLATPDLVSWWPFLCMGILIYGFIPRVCLFFMSSWGLAKEIERFEFIRPEFRQLLARMRTPVVDIEAPQPKPVPKAESTSGARHDIEPEIIEKSPEIPDNQALLLAADQIYSEPLLQMVNESIQQVYGIQISRVYPFKLNAVQPDDLFLDISFEHVDPVIILYEAWQPPIRGLIHSISQVRAKIPEKISLWIMLTGEAGEDHIYLEDNNESFQLWANAVRDLNHPMIVVKKVLSK